MIRLNDLANVGARRTCTPLYEQHQATPVATFLDPAETDDVYSGFVMTKTGPDVVSVMDSAVGTHQPFGLAALDRNDVIDDLQGIGGNQFAVWVGGPDAQFTIDAPAFDTNQSYTVPTDGSRAYLYCGTGAAKGKLTSTASGPICAELLQVVSATRIIVRPLAGVVGPAGPTGPTGPTA